MLNVSPNVQVRKVLLLTFSQPLVSFGPIGILWEGSSTILVREDVQDEMLTKRTSFKARCADTISGNLGVFAVLSKPSYLQLARVMNRRCRLV